MDAVKDLYDRQVKTLDKAERIHLAHLIMADLDDGVSSGLSQSATIAGTPLSELRRSAGVLSPEDADEMMQAIEEAQQWNIDESEAWSSEDMDDVRRASCSYLSTVDNEPEEAV